MGLDMYAWSVKDTGNLPDVDAVFSNPETGEDLPEFDRKQVFYWRKHPNLHGWMEALYREKGGTDESFNCNTVRLTVEDLKRLSEEVDLGTLPPTSGFFFGSSTPEDRNRDIEFIGKAFDEIKKGRAVYYDSWW